MNPACRASSLILVLYLLTWGMVGALCASEVPGRPEHLRKDVLLGTSYLYNRDLQRAEALFLKTIAQEPAHPSGHFYLAMVSWSRLAANPRFTYFLGVARMRMENGIEKVLTLMEERRNAAAGREKKLIWDNMRLYLLAAQALYSGRMDEARGLLETILARVDPSLDPFMAAFPLVKVGMSHDLQGDRETALEHYERVRSMENGAGGQFLAEKYLEQPIQPDDPFLAY